MTAITNSQDDRFRGGSGGIYRWECRCQNPPVLLGTYERNGRINIKVRDRYWHVNGHVRTICPRCGAEHLLDIPTATPSPAPDPH